MPHQCTNCGRAFDDGSKEMLSGCPDCGGNKFQFHPGEQSVPDEPDATAEPPEPPGPDSSVAKTVGNAAATVRDMVGGDSEPAEPAGSVASEAQPDAPAEPVEGLASEDTAQADARSAVVAPDEMPTTEGWDPTEAGEADTSPAPSSNEAIEESAETAEAEGPDLHELREELNDQFESIKVLNPGQYELNLMELYDREEYIIALQEDGRYVIQVPETFEG